MSLLSLHTPFPSRARHHISERIPVKRAGKWLSRFPKIGKVLLLIVFAAGFSTTNAQISVYTDNNDPIDYITKYNTANGAQLLRYSSTYVVSGTTYLPRLITAAGGKLYVAYGFRYLAELRASDGQRNWVVDAGITQGANTYFLEHISVSGGFIYANHNDGIGYISIYSAFNGVLQTRYISTYTLAGTPYLPRQATIAGDKLYVAYGFRYLAELRASDGLRNWVVDAGVTDGSITYPVKNLALDNGTVINGLRGVIYTTNSDPFGYVTRYRRSDGVRISRGTNSAEIEGTTYHPTLLSASAGGVYTTFGSRYLYALAPGDGFPTFVDAGVVQGANTYLVEHLTDEVPAPIITSAGTATGTVGQAFSYQIDATFSPPGFQAFGLPAGLSVNTSTGLISGTPTSAGTFTVNVTAINAGGQGTKTLTLTVNPSIVLVVAPASLTVNEGSTSAFSVKLNAQPAANVTVNTNRTSGDTDLTVSAGASLMLTPANWNTPQTVTLAAAEDADAANGVATFTVVSAGLPSQTVTATEADNDTQSLVILPLALSVPEGGANTFTVRLSVAPAANVTVTTTRTSGDTDLSVSAGASRTFTTANWNTTQTVTLAAAEDADAANGVATFTVASAGLTSQIVSATELDNDILDLDITQATLFVPEGTANTFAVKLTAQPATNMTVTTTKASGDPDLNVTGGASRTFTPANWNVSQTVTVSASEDADLADGQATFTVSTGTITKSVTAIEEDNEVIYVNLNYTGGNSRGSQTAPYTKVMDGVNASQTGMTIRIFVGNYPEPIAIDGSIKRPILERWEPAQPTNGTVVIGP